MEDNKEIVLSYLKGEYRNFSTTLGSIRLLLETLTQSKYNYFFPVNVAWTALSEREQSIVLLEFMNWSEERESKD